MFPSCAKIPCLSADYSHNTTLARRPWHLPGSKDAVSEPHQSARGHLVTLPNLITVARLLLVPTIVWFIIEGHFVAAFIVFVIAGIGDGVDGFIARQFDLRSRLGAYLDPLADKLLLVSIYLSLTFMSEIPGWLAVIVVSRDLFIIGGVILAWILDRPIEVRPLLVSKVNTAAQIIFAAVVIGDLAFTAGLDAVRDALVIIVGVLTVASAFAYLVDWVRHMAQD
jgi:cardiolipin synthase